MKKKNKKTKTGWLPRITYVKKSQKFVFVYDHAPLSKANAADVFANIYNESTKSELQLKIGFKRMTKK